ncbi:nucleoside triphosphate hydrolase [Leptospira tipperaryensis]|uniref:Nucleoside triphosphate hydrolase n=1 Tax=Leptospira tipperaryensis TaxID=2564040 RepID=A0A1D7UW87_9LEPT|nr:ATP-binding protein [Leptospira tipperaryensis]AOP33814.1 nucleoside triphosphate hydrolase [Leptospira tipperaryensis]
MTNISSEQVFTPRASKVNSKMYIFRDEIEKAFESAFKSSKHIIVHGESGSGKSWLYKNYFRNNNIFYEPANLANAARFDSISKELENNLNRLEKAKEIEYTETKEAEMGLGVLSWLSAKLKLNHIKKYSLTTKEPYEAILQYINQKSNKSKGVLVLDNFEAILGSPKLMQELSNIIILLDDERYSQYKVKILLVGTPSNIREYFKDLSSKETITNRLVEIPELPRFSDTESKTLVKRGFIELLKYQSDFFDPTSQHIHFVTDGIPDKLHDYCLILANNTPELSISQSALDKTDSDWLRQHLSDAYQTIVSLMNARTTEMGRRNQVLYALGKIKSSEFNYQSVETIVREEFPLNTSRTQLAIGQILSELSSIEGGILKRSQKKDAYLFRDPVYKMAIRSILKKQSDETVERIFIEDISR